MQDVQEQEWQQEDHCDSPNEWWWQFGGRSGYKDEVEQLKIYLEKKTDVICWLVEYGEEMR